MPMFNLEFAGKVRFPLKQNRKNSTCFKKLNIIKFFFLLAYRRMLVPSNKIKKSVLILTTEAGEIADSVIDEIILMDEDEAEEKEN